MRERPRIADFGSDPLVTCVGATQLDAKASNGAYVQEIDKVESVNGKLQM